MVETIGFPVTANQSSAGITCRLIPTRWLDAQ